tara:strand:- start:490 stop:648 length:159 start_codon:yes stop_codon:yes gene_type:complete
MKQQLTDSELYSALMDDDIREYLHSNLDENADFLKEYKKLHAEKFGEEFIVN